MKRVAIITLTKNANHGNVLQNIALQKVLKTLDCEPETIINYTGSSLFIKNKQHKFKWLLKFLLNYHDFRDAEIRNKNFRKCCKKHIDYSSVFYSDGCFSGPVDYDFFITGSDQVWNPTFGLATDYELLKFAPRHKKISYAASFGISNLDVVSDEKKQEIASELSKYKDISVREESGKQIVEELVSTSTYVNLDPTMLLNEREWLRYAEPVPFVTARRYVLLYMLGNITPEYNRQIKLISKKYNAVVINVMKGRLKYINSLQFIWLIKHSIAVCTDSFHAAVFSIIFHTQFYVFVRKDHHADQNSRFDSLLSVCGIDRKCVSPYLNNPIEWDEVDCRIKKKKDESVLYLQNHLNDKSVEVSCIEILQKEACCGCSACAQRCPQKCIEMIMDTEGFLYPSVDFQKCINCGLCRKACPIINAKPKSEKIMVSYAGYVKDCAIRLSSSSGGLFTPLAQFILKQGGVVFGAEIDEKQNVHHIIVTSIEELQKLRGSKYVQSEICNTYCEAKQYLDLGKIVLFTGTACQISGLKGYLQKEYKNLYTLDVLCHGTPSPKLWKRYLENQENKFSATVQKTLFRSKKYGWKAYAVELLFNDSTKYMKKFWEDPYMRLFLGNICLRPSCYNCKFKSLERDSDLSIGDAWGIEKVMPEMDDDMGTSVILVHSYKGEILLNNIAEEIVIKEGDVDKLLPVISDSRKSVNKHYNRSLFFKELNAGKSCDDLLQLLQPPVSCFGKVKRRLMYIKKKRYKAFFELYLKLTRVLR